MKGKKMELSKLEKKRDELKREIDNRSKDLYDVKDKMEDVLIDADYWTPKLRGEIQTFMDILDFKICQKHDVQKSLASVLEEIEEHHYALKKIEEPEPEAKYEVSITELNGLIWCRSFNSLPETKKFLDMCIQHPLHYKVVIRKG